MIPASYNLRNLTVRKSTTIATVSGLALVVFVFASVLMLSHGITKTWIRTSRDDIAIVLRKGAYSEFSSSIPATQVGVILAQPDVARRTDGQPDGVGEISVVATMDKVGTDGVVNVQIRGVTESSLAFRPEVKVVSGRLPRPGTDEVMVGQAIRGRIKGLDLDQTFELRKNRPASVVGVFSAEGASYESEIWTDIHTLGTAFGREGSVSSVRVRLTSPGQFNAFQAAAEQDPRLGLDVMLEREFLEKQSADTSTFIRAVGLMVGILFSVGAMIGAMITMHAAVANRRREIGTLRALGFSRFSILSSFLLESTVLALIGGAVGIAAASAMSFVRFSMMNMASWSEIVFTFEPTPGIMMTSMVIAAVMGIVGGLSPAIRAARMSPIDALRS